MCLKSLASFLDLMESVAVIVGTVVLIYGLQTWRVQRLGERRIELAEKILIQFTRAIEAIGYMRSSLVFSGEGKSRPKGEHEFEGDSVFLDRAYVAVERYYSRQDTFSELFELRALAKLYFGSECAERIDQVKHVLNELFSAAHTLGHDLWPGHDIDLTRDDQAAVDQHRMKIVKCEKILIDSLAENDDVRSRLKLAYDGIEKVLKPELKLKKLS